MRFPGGLDLHQGRGSLAALVEPGAVQKTAGPAMRCFSWRGRYVQRSLAGSIMITVEDINDAWGWMGLRAVEILGANAFGNLILRDADGSYWRLRPQDLCCEPVAGNRAALDALSYNQDFLNDWYMPELVHLAESTLGPLTDDRTYCLKIPSALGGHYGSENLATVPLSELIRFSGEGAQQLDGLPRWG
jgi:hypothetical protein